MTKVVSESFGNIFPISLQWKKVKDGRPTLTCIRPDGSRTWSHLNPFFPLHDLAHYSVETTLALREAFYGLLAAGWEISDFQTPGATERIPEEAKWVEGVVGTLDQERGMGRRWTAEEFNEALQGAVEKMDLVASRSLGVGELDEIRALFSGLAGRWYALDPGDTLELQFEPRSNAV